VIDCNELDIPNDQCDAIRFLSDSWADRFIHERDVWRGLVLGPFPQVVAGEDDVVLTPVDLREEGLEGTFSDILHASFEEGFLIVFDTRVERDVNV